MSSLYNALQNSLFCFISIEGIELKLSDTNSKEQKGEQVASNVELGKPIQLNDSNYYSKMKSEGLMVTDFWAAWCGPCRMVAPIIEELAKEYAGRVTFAKLNVDENPVVSQQLGIMSIPTLIVSKNGQVLDVIVGALPKQMLKEKVESFLDH